MSTLSTILITHNEEQNLPRCLGSIRWSDEVIVVDSGSTDRTSEIAREHGARFFAEEWKGYTAQKNSALDKASSEWVLSIDADEELAPGTQETVRRIVRENSREADGYFFRRKVFYLGKWIMHGDWYPDYVLRLWRRSSGRFEGGNVHESVAVAGATRQLPDEILHYTYKDLADQRNRMERYARMWAEDRALESRRAGLADLWLRPLWRFIRGFILKFGFLDGWRGALIAWCCARETCMKYKYLAEKTGSK